MSLLDKLVKQERSRRIVSDVFAAEPAVVTRVKVNSSDSDCLDLIDQLDELEALIDSNAASKTFDKQGMIRELEYMLLRHI